MTRNFDLRKFLAGFYYVWKNSKEIRQKRKIMRLDGNAINSDSGILTQFNEMCCLIMNYNYSY